MAHFVKLDPARAAALRQIDERLVSYNVEMTEVTGGTFWKAYTDAQVDGTEAFPEIRDWTNMGNLQQWYDPIDTTNPRLIKLARDLGPAWVRVSGTWANKTYYDFDNKYGGKVPEGFQNVLSRQQWLNLLTRRSCCSVLPRSTVCPSALPSLPTSQTSLPSAVCPRVILQPTMPVTTISSAHG